MSSSELRELFEACKTGDLVKVKKLLTQQNVNEIGELFDAMMKCSKDLFMVNVLLQTRRVDDRQRCISRADMEGKMSLNIF